MLLPCSALLSIFTRVHGLATLTVIPRRYWTAEGKQWRPRNVLRILLSTKATFTGRHFRVGNEQHQQVRKPLNVHWDSPVK
jgi:hypothetical protein